MRNSFGRLWSLVRGADRTPQRAADDFHSFDLDGAIAQTEVEQVDGAHVVIYVDTVTASVEAAGPFTSVVEACGYAAAIQRELGLWSPGAVTVAPLHPADG